jgi:nitroimidazol reductase NimA-like FMN-containing flavoprotein (pyridoxamine 5'-phosphate oxidase superfamily)
MEQPMSPEFREAICGLLANHRIMAVATNRNDGWPQATTVSYVNDGLNLYFFVARVSQKFANILRDARVSIAIASDFHKPEDIRGLSLAGKAKLVESGSEYKRIWALFLARFPEYADWPAPGPAFAPMFRVVPEIVSVLDYSKGFGHSDLTVVSRTDLGGTPGPKTHDWLNQNQLKGPKVVPAVRPTGWMTTRFCSSVRTSFKPN